MKSNMSKIDRIIRLIAAFFIGILYLGDRVNGFSAFILGIIALIVFFSGVSGFCPLYALLFSDKKK